MVQLVTIAGSPSSPSRSAAVLDYARRDLEQRIPSLQTETIIIRDLNPAELLYADWNGATIRAALGQVAAADAVIMATPVYKAAYSGVLKAFLDVLPQNALAGKVVLPIVTGASPAHMLALDYALKPVLAALGAGDMLMGVYLLDSQFDYKTGVQFHSPEAEAMLQAALAALSQKITN